MSARVRWRPATVIETKAETPHARSLLLAIEDWPGHLAGQHVDVRLTAEDGYQAVRSYSIGSAPETPLVEITAELVDDGEVSPYLVEGVAKGDRFEVLGPIGGHFVWRAELGGPLFLVAGGSGIVPLMAMLRHRAAVGVDTPARLLYSSRAYPEIIYREELGRLADDPNLTVVHTLTRRQPRGWTGYDRRVDRAMLEAVAWPAAERPLVYVCGPTPFVELVASSLTELGYPPETVKTERFGPTGR
jgi:ferredoxin-NADP reductase